MTVAHRIAAYFSSEVKNLPIGVRRSEDSFQRCLEGEIPIIHTGNYSGHGNIMSSLYLAEGLAKSFPEKKVVLYLQKQNDYDSIRRVYPHFSGQRRNDDPSNLEIKYQQVVSAQDMPFAIYNPIKPEIFRLKKSPPQEDFFTGKAKVNLYLQEYDCDRNIQIPDAIKQHVPYIDESGNVHVILRTGVGKDGFGIFIDERLKQRQKSRENRERLLQRVGVDTKDLEKIVAAKWAFAYCGEERGKSFEKYFLDPLCETQYDDDVYIFDFSTFVDNFVQKETTDGLEKNVYRYCLGNREHDLLLDFMAESDVPLCVTGDMSLSEAISMERLFVYDSRLWKAEIRSSLVSFGMTNLAKADAERCHAMFGGFNPFSLEDYFSYKISPEEAASFFKPHRERLLEVIESIQTPDYAIISERFKERFQRDGCLTQRVEELIEALALPLYAGSFYLGTPLPSKYSDSALFKQYVEYGIGSYQFIERIFYDPVFQESFQKLIKEIKTKKDLKKNLSFFINGCLL